MPTILDQGAGLSKDAILGQALAEISSAMVITYQTERIKDSQEFRTMESVFDLVLGDALSMARWNFLCVYNQPREYKTCEHPRNSHIQQYQSVCKCCGSSGGNCGCSGQATQIRQDTSKVGATYDCQHPAPVYHTHCCGELVIKFRDEELRLLPHFFIKLLITKLVIKTVVALKGDLNIRRYYEREVLPAHLSEAMLADKRCACPCYSTADCCDIYSSRRRHG